jgi:hypothetical protein
MVWTTAYSCPRFMIVPLKPHPFGNEWHTIFCGLCASLVRLELIEGKYSPLERGTQEYQERGKTVGLLLRLTKWWFWIPVSAFLKRYVSYVRSVYLLLPSLKVALLAQSYSRGSDKRSLHRY